MVYAKFIEKKYIEEKLIKNKFNNENDKLID